MAENTKKNLNRVEIYMDQALIEAGKKEAIRKHMSFSQMMRYLLLKELDRLQRF
jgi:hypothetical protein